jgi:hypothetical protein
MEFTKRKENANYLQFTLSVVGVFCGCVTHAVRHPPRERRLRRGLVPSRVDVGAPTLTPRHTPRTMASLDRHPCAPAAPPANMPAFCGARPPAVELPSSSSALCSSGALPLPRASPARTTASDRGHPARRFRLPVVASEDLRLRREELYFRFFSLSMQTASPFAFSVGNRFSVAQCLLASHFCICMCCWT